MVTALELWHSSMTSMRSLVVPKFSSRTRPAEPNLSDLRDHLVELLGLVLAQETVVLNAGDVQLVLGLWLWWFKWASEDSNLYITKLIRKSRLTFRIGKKTTLNIICSYLRRINVSYFTLSDKTKFNTDNKWFSQQDTLAWVWLQLASGSMSKNFCMPCK